MKTVLKVNNDNKTAYVMKNGITVLFPIKKNILVKDLMSEQYLKTVKVLDVI